MNNSDTLKFDYTLPVGELPHRFYKMYISTDFGYDLIGVFKEERVRQIPDVLDRYYLPEFKHYLIVGRSFDDGDELVDGGEIVQETYRHKKNKEGKRK